MDGVGLGRVGPTGVPALKEWAGVVHALLEGRQTLLLRKGGIREKRFEVGARAFLLFPTVAHGHADAVRPGFADLLVSGQDDVSEDRVVLRAACEVVDAIVVRRPDRLAEVEEFHLWTRESVQRTRVDFRPRHELTALVVRTRPLTPTVEAPRTREQVGCFSWLTLPGPPPPAGDPVRGDADLSAVAAAVRDRVG
ncbi:DUF1802 family protein [Kineococcus gynurae]|uniref:DUF1802 family protein n=1 Tax=Kineococcus gynurae TaxID=452979 RepID=A0ABV5LNI7_9ACTN